MESTDRPKLAARVRVRLDRQTGQHMLLYPERGMALNDTAHDIVTLCTGERTLAEIVHTLRMKYQTGERLETDVRAFLVALYERGLVELAP
jgi:coenzyme PQQ biosynthesis protein PqqD